MKKVLLVGCGHMGSALLNSWIKLKTFSFGVVDPYNYKELKKINYNGSFAIESQRGRNIENQATKNYFFFKNLIKKYINK